MRHEDAARIKIDSQLKACGWEVQDYPDLGSFVDGRHRRA